MPRRIDKKKLEEQIEYTENTLQAEILAANPPKIKETIEKSAMEQESNISVPPSKRKEGLRRFFKRAKS